jgi:uncharacterized protein
MKKNVLRTAITLLFLFVAGNVWAESSVWVVAGPKAKVYLAGSCHVLRAADYPLPAEFSLAYQDSRKIVFEAPQDDMAGPEFQEKLLRASSYSDGTTLKQHLSRDAYEKAAAFCKKRNYPMEIFQIFRPWMFAMTLTMQEMKNLGAEPNYGIDYVFNEKSRRDGKIVGNLETVDEQIGFLTMMDEGMDNEQIIQTIDELGQLSVKLPDILNAWRKGDETKIEELLFKDVQDYPKLYRALIVDRNRRWLQKIEGYLNGRENMMVVVGVAHLVGNNGVVEMLKKLGYKVVKLQRSR